jgi:hypothetical protein
MKRGNQKLTIEEGEESYPENELCALTTIF